MTASEYRYEPKTRGVANGDGYAPPEGLIAEVWNARADSASSRCVLTLGQLTRLLKAEFDRGFDAAMEEEGY